MKPDILSLQIASGILIAALIITIALYAAHTFRQRDWWMCLLTSVFTFLIGGTFIAAGLGIVPWQ